MRIDNKSDEIQILTDLPINIKKTLNQWRHRYNMVVEHIQTGPNNGCLTFMVKRTPKPIQEEEDK